MVMFPFARSDGPRPLKPAGFFVFQGPALHRGPRRPAGGEGPAGGSGSGRIGAIFSPIAANGYRFAKWQGESNPDVAPKALQRSHFRDSAGRTRKTAFTLDSSRYLNCPSNLIGHDDPNKPANGEADNGTF